MSTPPPTASTSSQAPRSLNRQVVLDEDEYTEALSHIVARDFFPSLVHLDATNDYLDALHSKDPQAIQASVRRLEGLATPVSRHSRPWQTPSQTPYAAGPSDTPLRTPRGEAPAKRARYDTNMSLDNFQAKYTSEDNSSFTQILEEENRKRREKWGWAWEAQKRVEAQRDRMLEGRERLLIEAPPATGVREKFRIEAPALAGLIADVPFVYEEEEDEVEDILDGTHKQPEQTQAVVVKEKEEVDVMAPKKDTRPAGVDGWKFKTRNALMFPPDADQSPYHPSASKALENAKSAPRVIKYGNTRLPEQDETRAGSPSAPPSPTRSRIDAAIAGTPYHPSSSGIDKFSLVPAIPTLTPSQLGPAAMKQLMTWGTLNATPRILSQSDDPAESIEMPPPSTPFRIMEPSSRERISHKLSNNASKSLRAKAGLLGIPGISRTPASGSALRKGSMPPPSWTPRKAEAAGALTPAAKRLLNRTTMGAAASRRADAMEKLAGWEGTSAGKAREKDLQKVRWTPTPSPVTRRG
ncbi:Protein DGCR14 [Grifola frondosa]|uniref:Protein DGCR14 n=1 Tax=Grifola frondosa TaxID=5627 RepID=A0A1C7MVK5_GRIFR|nr:Protein DGCR14 [Grifola frondosa]